MKIMQIIARHKNHFAAQLYKNLKMVSESPGNVVFELKIEKEHKNPVGMFHGGTMSLIIDDLTIFTMAAMSDGQLGATVDLSVKYLNPAKLGDTVLINTKLLKNGKRMAFFDCDILEKTSGKMIAQGRTILKKVSVNEAAKSECEISKI